MNIHHDSAVKALMQQKRRRNRKDKQCCRRKIANRLRHRLLSIRYDVDSFCRPVVQHLLLQQQHSDVTQKFPIIANERCGSWYAYSLDDASSSDQGAEAGDNQMRSSCYFKSTDGHAGTWNFSLKRLNLHVVRAAAEAGACIVVDASANKEMPDSFSRTIPIWCAVLNKIAERYRNEIGLSKEPWNCDLFTPSSVISEAEQHRIESLLPERLETLYQSGAVVDPAWLARTLRKPLRPYWITRRRSIELSEEMNDYYAIICLSCSDHELVSTGELPFHYTPGAADDQESWARHLSPNLFWSHIKIILDESTTDDETDVVVDMLVNEEKCRERTGDEITTVSSWSSLFDPIGETGIAIGTRRAGRPPECWSHFDAILNVTDMEYSDLLGSVAPVAITPSTKGENFYLQLPVKEGKRDRSELERFMAVGILFVALHAQQKRRILIHCAQGKDRSVAVAMAIVLLFCNLKYPLRWKDAFWELDFQALFDLLSRGGFAVPNRDAAETRQPIEADRFRHSGLPASSALALQGREGRDRLFRWIRTEFKISRGGNDSGSITTITTKETARIALHLVRQDREQADPTRCSMQKINRFFMSNLNLDGNS
jgi:tRNA A64-2'-O-ribosylphosphate transferase